MNRQLLALTITVAVSSLLFATPTAAQPRPAEEKAEHAQILKEPALESATDHSAIISWTTNTGGSVVHYGIVHYGTDPQNLSQTAKSPNRWNKNLPYMTYRVRVDGLKPGTAYYYTVDAMLGKGSRAGLKSPVQQFTTRQHP